jgi:hypothetical protein
MKNVGGSTVNATRPIDIFYAHPPLALHGLGI